MTVILVTTRRQNVKTIKTTTNSTNLYDADNAYRRLYMYFFCKYLSCHLFILHIIGVIALSNFLCNIVYIAIVYVF